MTAEYAYTTSAFPLPRVSCASAFPEVAVSYHYFPVLTDIFKRVNIDSLCNMMSKVALDNALRVGLQAARRYLHTTVVNVARAVRTANASSGAGMYGATSPQQGNAQQLDLPPSLALLPLYGVRSLRFTLCFLKCSTRLFPSRWRFKRLQPSGAEMRLVRLWF